MTCFLLYLIGRFAKENKNAEIRDPILGHMVPNFVFLQNQKLLKEALKDKLELDDSQKSALLLHAQSTEYMHAVFRENGLALLDEKIGIEFIDTDKTIVEISHNQDVEFMENFLDTETVQFYTD